MSTAQPQRVLDGRIALVTGAPRGIGYPTAKAFAAAAPHIVAVARTAFLPSPSRARPADLIPVARRGSSLHKAELAHLERRRPRLRLHLLLLCRDGRAHGP